MSISRELRPHIFDKYQRSLQLGVAGTRDTDSRVRHYELNEILHEEMCVLDVGCNTGLIALAIAPMVREVVGIDAHAPFIEQAQRYQEQLNIANASFLAAPFQAGLFESERFHLILSLAAHFWMVDLSGYLADLEALLNPKGFLLIESHNLNEEHHHSDWAKVCDQLIPRFSVIRRARSQEKLSYDGQAGTYDREFLLLRREK